MNEHVSVFPAPSRTKYSTVVLPIGNSEPGTSTSNKIKKHEKHDYEENHNGTYIFFTEGVEYGKSQSLVSVQAGSINFISDNDIEHDYDDKEKERRKGKGGDLCDCNTTVVYREYNSYSLVSVQVGLSIPSLSCG